MSSLQPTGGPILLFDSAPSEPKSLLELKAKKKTAPPAPAPGQTTSGGADTAMGGMGAAMAGFGAGAGGAAAAAGVLNAVDEDDEGGEEAPVPGEFEIEEDEDEEGGE